MAPDTNLPPTGTAVRILAGTVREPSCSHYAIAALRGHGALRGTALAARRVLRCNPWHPGGYDPVPPRPTETPTDLMERTTS